MRECLRWQRVMVWASVVLLMAPLLSHNLRADENEKISVAAPAGSAEFSSALGGSFFVDVKLLENYNALKVRLRERKQEIGIGQSTNASALKELAGIESESTQLHAEIEATKTFVAALNVYREKVESTFALADSRRMIVIGDNVRIRGWSGPGIKCVMEKRVLANEPPEEAEFAAIKINHDERIAVEIVGKTADERTADELKFRNSEAGENVSDEQLRSREEFWRKQFGGYDVFADFQGKQVNVLSVAGLTYEEGNRQVTAHITSEGGRASMRSEWRRHVSVTIFVPPCEHVMVAGCMVKLDIKDVEANLLLTTSQSRDRDYEGTFEVRKIDGDLTIDQAPVRLIDEVAGNVAFEATDEFVNSGTMHSGGYRTAYSFETQGTEIRNISGGLKTHFLRTELSLEGVGGPIDVTNEYGDTRLELAKGTLKEAAMRIISECGEILVVGSAESLTSIPIHAFTLCGRVRTDLKRETLEDFNFSTQSDNSQRNWSGFETPTKEKYSLTRFERPQRALDNAEREAGLDLISKSGRVSILTE